MTGSLALIADSAHMATDARGLALALFATHFTQKRATPQKTNGYLRADIPRRIGERGRPAHDLLPLRSLQTISGAAGYPERTNVGCRRRRPDRRPDQHEAACGGFFRKPQRRGAYFEILSDMLGSLGVIAATLKEGADGAPDFVRAVPADVHHQEGILIRPVIARRCGRQHHRPAVQGGAIRDLRCHPIVGLVVMTNYRGRFSIVFTLVNSRPTPWPLIRLSPMLL